MNGLPIHMSHVSQVYLLLYRIDYPNSWTEILIHAFMFFALWSLKFTCWAGQLSAFIWVLLRLEISEPSSPHITRIKVRKYTKTIEKILPVEPMSHSYMSHDEWTLITTKIILLNTSMNVLNMYTYKFVPNTNSFISPRLFTSKRGDMHTYYKIISKIIL